MSIVNPDLTGGYFQLNNPEGTDIYTLADLSVQTNFTQLPKKDYTDTIGGFSDALSLSDLGDISYEESNQLVTSSLETVINIDKTNLTSYAYFGSLVNKLNYSVNKIIKNWPASLYVTDNVNGYPESSVQSYSYDTDTDTTSFLVPAKVIENKFGLNYVSNNNEDKLSNLITNFKNYAILYGDEEYKLTSFSGSPKQNSGFIAIKCKGQPFKGFNATKFRVEFHVKPLKVEMDRFYNILNDLESYLINRDSTPKYKSTYKVRQVLDNGTIVHRKESFTWPVTDGYNIDTDSQEFLIFLDGITNLFKSYDTERTDLLIRRLSPDTLLEYDTEDQRVYKLLSSYGYNFDEMKKFIDGLAFSNRVTYDNKENLSNIFVKNVANSLGWGVLNTNNENDFLKNILGNDDNIKPNVVDQEFWRRVVINTSWVVQSKGTRKAVEFLFRLIGAPECLFEFNEHVYVSQNTLDPTESKELLDSSPEPDELPFDVSGNPKYIANSTEYWFQNDGGWYEINENITPSKEPLGAHVGDYDRGQRYFDKFRDAGFQLIREIDNKKSWRKIRSTGETRSENSYNTEYYSDDEQLIFNSKEVSLSIDIAKAIECDVYNCNKLTDTPINVDGVNYSPLPTFAKTKFDVSNVTFTKYINNVLKYFIDAKNRKIIDDAHGGGYPSLKLLYEKYYKNTNCSSLSYKDISDYVEQLDTFWLDFIAQAIPATTIFIGNGEKWRNTIFHSQKYVYKRGINDGSEFQTIVKVDDDLPLIETQLLKLQGTITKPMIGRLGTLSIGLDDINFQYPCLGGSDVFYSRTNIGGVLQKIYIGEWDAQYTSVNGVECEGDVCDTYYVECSYVEDGYFECPCETGPSDPCLMDYIDCDYIDSEYID